MKASDAAAYRQRRRATMPAAIPLKKIPAALRGEPRLERESMLLPHLCAEKVCREAAHLLNSPAPLRFAPWLARRARHLYATNAKFNRRLRGAVGREWLYAFLRHWLSARLARRYPMLARHLPTDFKIGQCPR